MRQVACRLFVNVVVVFVMCLCSMKVSEVAAAATVAGPRTILLIGSSDAAKQLVGNCLLSSSSRQDAPPLNMSHPFSSRQNASETHCSAFMNGDQLVVIDAYGMGDRRVDQHFALGLLQKSLAAVANQVYLVLVVFKRRDIVSNELLSYIRLFNQRVLKRTRAEAISPNVAFVCDDDTDEKSVDNVNYQQLLSIVERKRVFSFDFDNTDENYDYRPQQEFGKRSLPSDHTALLARRIEASRRLATFVADLTALDLSHVQEEKFVADMARETRALFVDASLSAKHKRRIILVGYTGAGKSTVANCLFNRRGSHYHIQSHPFRTSDSATGCTSNATILSNDELVLIDTVGFGDPRFNQTSVIETFQQGLAMLNNTVDLVVFVMKRDRFGVHLAEFFEHIHDELFRGLMHNNSVLVCSGCQKGWLDENRRESPALDRVLSMCANRSVEFKLNFDMPEAAMPPPVRDALEEMFENARQQAIDGLVAYLDGLRVDKVNLDYVQEARFKKLFLEHIALTLIEANAEQLVSADAQQAAVKYIANTGIGLSVLALGTNLVRRVDPLLNALSVVYLTVVSIFYSLGGSSVFACNANALANKCLVSFQFEVREYGPASHSQLKAS